MTLRLKQVYKGIFAATAVAQSYVAPNISPRDRFIISDAYTTPASPTGDRDYQVLSGSDAAALADRLSNNQGRNFSSPIRASNITGTADTNYSSGFADWENLDTLGGNNTNNTLVFVSGTRINKNITLVNRASNARGIFGYYAAASLKHAADEWFGGDMIGMPVSLVYGGLTAGGSQTGLQTFRSFTPMTVVDGWLTKAPEVTDDAITINLMCLVFRLSLMDLLLVTL